MMEIRAEHLTKSYEGRPVLRDVTFTAGAGITRIAGRSGAGKTTLLRILLGLEAADSGEVHGLAGLRLSAVFQEDRLLEHLSAEGNLRFVLGRVYDPAAARALLESAGGIKPAIVMHEARCTREEAERALCAADGFVARAIAAVARP